MIVRGFRATNSTGTSYTLAGSATVSAGVYQSNRLVRTLFSGQTKTAGSYSVSWDGKLDDLTTNASAGTYQIKVVANNITTTWEGVLGNSSTNLTGSTVHRQFLPFQDMCINGTDAYACADFAEREGSVYKIALGDIQKKIDVLPHNQVQQTTQRVCTDGVRLYMGGYETQSGTSTYVAAATFANLADYSSYLSFQGATVTTFGTVYKACDVVASANRISGMAVQVSGNYLFVTRKLSNSLHVVHKTTGVVAQTLTYTAPTLVAVDGSDNLWMAHNNGTVEKFTVNSSTGAITSASVSITGLTDVQGLTANGSLVLIADAASTHQIKAYNLSGTSQWNLGTGSYSTNATVADNKFYFKDVRTPSDQFSFVTFQSDGSFWVGDKGNYRYIKFNSSRTYVDKISFLPHIWSSYVDPNTPTRVFADYLEFTVDYAQALNTATLVRNWGFNVTSNDDGDHDRLRFVTTLSNSRTYCLQPNGPAFTTWEIAELVSGGTLRFTGVTVPRYENYQLTKNGDIVGVKYSGGNVIWEKNTLTGFDGSNNPTYSGFANIAQVPDTSTSAKPAGDSNRIGEITSDGVITTMRADLDNVYHIGGVQIGDTAWKFQTGKTVNLTFGQPFPPTGDYDIGQNVIYGGSTTLALDNFIIWGYRGEFWQNGQTNKWNILNSDGLFLNQFGTISDSTQAQSQMAGNAFSPSLVKVGSDYYLYHNDESYHGGVHRWKISNTTLQNFTINITI